MPAAKGTGDELIYYGANVYNSPSHCGVEISQCNCSSWTWLFSSGNAGAVSVIYPGQTGCTGWAGMSPYIVPARPAGTVYLHPGYYNEHPQLQWTAPLPGQLNITGLTYAIDQAGCHNAAISVYHNQQRIVRVNTLLGSAAFVLQAGVQKGDVLTFGIDWGDDNTWGCDGTGLDATIVYVSAAPPPSPSPSPDCPPALYRPLPRTDLVGALLGNAWYPGTSLPAASESSCRQSCCDAPFCDAYTFAVSELQLQLFQSTTNPVASCFLYTNVTALVPSSGYTSGALLSAYS